MLTNLGNDKIIRNWRRDYNAKVYDLGVGPQNTCILIDRSSRSQWLTMGDDKGGIFSYLGPVRQGLTDEHIQADCEMQLADMGDYELLTNNCYTFVRKIYRAEKLLT